MKAKDIPDVVPWRPPPPRTPRPLKPKAAPKPRRPPRRKPPIRPPGKSHPALYYKWRSMIRRCEDPKSPGYRNYGARGIRVCALWRRSFQAFLAWALASGHQPGLSIERLDNDRGYSPANCTWTTLQGQGRNRRTNRLVTAWGETRCVAAWADDPRCEVSEWQLRRRLNKGMEPERALTEPIHGVTAPRKEK